MNNNSVCAVQLYRNEYPQSTIVISISISNATSILPIKPCKTTTKPTNFNYEGEEACFHHKTTVVVLSSMIII